MTEEPLLLRLAMLVHRASLRLHPRIFRREFGDELVETFREQAADILRIGGTRALVRLLARTLLDTLVTRVAQRRTLRAVGGRGSGERNGYRRSGGGEMLGTFFRDAGVGLRGLLRRPVFTGAAVAALALGIGANAAIFSVVNGVLLRSLSFPDAERIVRLYHVDRTGDRSWAFSIPDREDWAEGSRSLSSIGVYTTLPSGLLLTGGDEAVEVRTAYVSAGFFETLGRDAYLGRVLRDAEEHGDNRVVVFSHGFWLRRFGGDESIVGTSIQLDDTGFLVAGVMPPDFVYPAPDVEAWVFLSVIPPESIPLQRRDLRLLEAIGRLEAGTSIERAAEELSIMSASLAEAFPGDNGDLTAAAVVPLRETMTAGVETMLLVLLGTVGLVLLIACANVATLMLARGVERRGELQLRQALGADRPRLVRQLMTESLVLSGAGGLVGVALAVLGTETLVDRSVGLLPRAGEIGVDGAVVAFSLVLTVLTAFVFGLMPALRLTRDPGTEGFQVAGRIAGARAGISRTWGVLVATQVGLAIVVVIASGLLLRSLWELQGVDLGMDTDHLVALSITINDARYPERAQYLAVYDQLMERLAAAPRVESVGSIRFLPLRGDGESIPGPSGPSDGERRDATYLQYLQVSPGFFRTAGVPLVSGRDFTSDDRAESPPVVIINDALRRRYYPGETPIGEAIALSEDYHPHIVGIVGDIRQRSLSEDARPTIYVPQTQNPRRGMAFVMRVEGDPATALADVRAVVRSVDPDQPIENLQTMDEVAFASTAQPRFFSGLLASFAVLALLLASVGIYGVVSHSVSRRTAEIGIRVALGAPHRSVVGMVVRVGMLPVMAGAALGLLASAFVMRALGSILFDVSVLDAWTFTTVPLLLVGVAFLACWIPARRAVRIDPTQALRRA